MSLATMRNNILRFCPGLNPDIISSIIQDSYRQLGLMEWNRLELTRQISTVAPYSTGTVTIDYLGTVTGVGTTFIPEMVGRHMRVHYSDSIFEISSVASATELALRNWTGEVIAAATAFTILKIIYAADTSLSQIFNVAYQTSLDKKSQDFFSRRDPARTTTGSPTWWAFAGYNTGGYPNIEIYPVPDQIYPLRLYGKMAIPTLTDVDTPYLPEDLVESHALISCFRAKQAMDPSGQWGERIREQSPHYAEIFASAKDDDNRLGSHRDKVKDYMDVMELYPASDSFWAAHDIE